jgi:hypothetical protein
VKVAVVVQRYGADINGGAELHARYIAEHLARHTEVEVLTTCARDYVTWRNELPAGVEQIGGVTVSASRSRARATRTTSGVDRRRCSRGRTRSPTNWPGWRARGRRAPRS